jgi:S1-C subfamily serine protease
MADKTESNTKADGQDSHSVSSKASRLGNKTITVTIPTIDTSKVKAPESRRVRYGLFAFAFIIVSVVSGVFGGWLFTRNNSNGMLGVSLSNQKQIVTSDSQLITAIAKSVGPSVVSVNVNIQQAGSSTGGFGLFGFSQPKQMQAAGTGIIISSGGLIVTNRHVVPVGTTSVSVTLSNGTELKDVSVLGRTSASDSLDIAFLKINNTKGQKLTPAIIGNSAQMQVGNSVVAIGNALGQFQNTVTSGIISGYGRSVAASDGGGSGSSTNVFGAPSSTNSAENLNDLFQTDAAINEGNSGGPLVNLNGQVIGINTAIAGNAQNIGFAIPINEVKGLINQVVKTGKFKLPYLGVRYIPLTADVANEYNLSVQSGAFVAPSNNTTTPSVVQGSPASQSAIEVSDIITAVNGTPVNQGNSLNSLLDQYIPGTNVTLTVIRNNKTIQINTTLGTDPNS